MYTENNGANSPPPDPSGKEAASQALSSYSLVHLLLGGISLLFRSGSGISRIVGEIHHTFQDLPLPWSGDHVHDINRAPRPYGYVRRLLDGVALRIQSVHDVVPRGRHLPLSLYRLLSAINGVLGDKLVEWQHPLAVEMDLVDEDGHTGALPELSRSADKGLVIFIHGLCLSEYEWQGENHDSFVRQLKEDGYAVGWLRYNTGRPIWENGKQLSALLDDQLAESFEGKSLVLIGHSMGGLVIRSACYYARNDYQYPWLSGLTHVACLASPHAGAPLEKIGNSANSILGLSPYSKPLMALGNIRSLGIRSLRHGNVTEPHEVGVEQIVLPFDGNIQYLLVGAKMKDLDPRLRWLGDGLVPLESAMGGVHFPDRHESVYRVMIRDAGHIRLLQDGRLYDALGAWLTC